MLANFLDGHPNFERFIDSLGGTSDEVLGSHEVVLRLLAACVVGWVIGQVYRRTFTGRRFSPTLPDTHMLLCLGGAMIWLVVGDNLVRAFGLAGTIGLIRYRTVVRDPKDTTILLFSMIMGMACGLGQYSVAILGTVVILLVLVMLHRSHRSARAQHAKRSADLLDLLDADGKPAKDKKPPKK